MIRYQKTFDKYLLVLSFFLILVGCQPGGGSTDDEPAPVPLNAVNLVFPLEGRCEEGVPSPNDKVYIDFQWNSSTAYDNYELFVWTSSIGNPIVLGAGTTTYRMELEYGQLYNWKVNGIFGDQTKSSSTIEFFSESEADPNYAPYPAQISFSEISGGSARISWSTDDLDDDPLTYTLYLDITEDPQTLILENTTLVTTTVDNLTAGKRYYAKIISSDGINTSVAIKSFLAE